MLKSLSRSNVPIEKLDNIINASRLLIEAGASPFDRFKDVFTGGSSVFRASVITLYEEKETRTKPSLDSRGQTLLHYP